MRKVFYGIVFLAIIASCTKTEVETVTTGGEYLTLSAGSTWNYKVTDIQGGGTVSSYTLTSTNKDSILQGSNFHVYSKSNAENEYYNVSGNWYNTYKRIPVILGGYSKFFRYLDMGNNSWQDDLNILVSGNPQTLRLNNIIVEKDTNRVVNGITYTKVVCVRTDYSFPSLPAYFTGYTKSYYAPRFGLIEDSTNFTLLPNVPAFTVKERSATTLMSASLN